MDKRINLSILIITLNEEKNIKHALESIKWANEIFVVDSFSIDRTLEIAKKYKNVKIFQHSFENFAKQRNWALNNLPWHNDWIFILDADERITPELRKEITEIILGPQNDIVAYWCARRFIFLNKWIKYADCYPSWMMKLFLRNKGRFEKAVNEKMIVDGKTAYLKNDMVHENLKGIKDWIAKHNRYSTFETEEIYFKKKSKLPGRLFGDVMERRKFLKNLFYKLPFRPFLRFFYMYFLKLGFLDGSVGFIYCVLKAIQEFHINVKLKELKLKQQKDERV